ncbi:MAG TPA: hypothetical protein VJ553_03775, partial [Candidatus Paceibacterota bacterium]|nr:hypothetical protein [Candidatus Paceibacterota bacterium]
YMLPNRSDQQYPRTLEQFFKDHENQACSLVGDYVVAGMVFGHYFRCSCPSSNAPPPCENGSIPAQELTTE